MPNFSISPELFPADNDNKPLPLLVAEKWDFPLAYAEEDGEFWYSAQDWVAGILETDNIHASKRWDRIQRRVPFNNTELVQKFPYRAKDKKTYQRDFTNEWGLLTIIERLQVAKSRKRLGKIRNFLASNYPFLTHLAVTIAERTPFEISEAALQTYLVEIIKRMNIYDQVQTQRKLSSYRIIDIVVSSPYEEDILIECKLDLLGSDLYRAIGQVLIYAKEYEAETGIYPIPAIATLESEENIIARKTCQLMGIQLWELVVSSKDEFFVFINGVAQTTGKPLLEGRTNLSRLGRVTKMKFLPRPIIN